MTYILIPLVALSLTGCFKSIPVKMDFPDVPSELKQSCPDLKQNESQEQKLSKIIEVVSENYSSYHECKIKVDAWIEWYNLQKQISDSVK